MMKKYIETLAPIVFCLLWVPCLYAQERIYSSSELFLQAKNSLERGEWRKAELLIFALIQKNADQYLSDRSFREDLNRGLRDARNRNRPAQSSAQQDEGVYLPYTTRLLSGSETPVSFMSGVYKDADGVTYEITRIGKEIWWLSTTPNKIWRSVMYGEISGDVIRGQWTFIPSKGPYSHGSIKLKIRGPRVFAVEDVSGAIQGIGNMQRGAIFRCD